ncbi:glycosyltransferase family protein [Xylanibacter brevis]|uniref:glycosyl transferase n=1 Tax=Xylanibacter brevis TaxID=83231 RepID=UPI000488555C|nr:glycosyl transferase [Xylanibacter brevis]
MRILLLGEYSNVHATLAEGLRALGHEVTVASNGDFWKNYPRDIDLARKEGKLGGIALMAKIYALLPTWRNYDVVQLINPMFVELKAERIFPIYRYLRKHNKKMVLCAMGMDYYWVHESTYKKPMRYSDFNIGDQVRTEPHVIKDQQDWLGTPKEQLNKLIAEDCDAIVSGLYDDHICYQPYFSQKLTYIPLPIKMPSDEQTTLVQNESTSLSTTPTSFTKEDHTKLKVFIGISKGRSAYKGTDIMLKAAEDLLRKYPDKMELMKAEGVPFAEYQHMMDGSDAILDQLYSYTPSMNPLLAMSKGIICIGGGEPENYEIINEHELRPIINVQPTYESVYNELEQLILNPSRIPMLKKQSIEYVKRHHDYLKVAKQYEQVYR